MNRGWLRFLRLAVLGLLIALSLQAGMAVAVQETGGSTSSEIISQTSIMQQGEDAYQAGQLSAAITLWQQAAARYEATGDRLNHALVLGFLASAFSDLGQWPAANEAIAQARSQLDLDAQPPASGSSDAAAVLAQVLTLQGTLQLSQGQTSEAFETWQAAEVTYR